MSKIITEVKKVEGISCLFFYPEKMEKSPLIIICHSLSKDKYENVNLSLKLAEKGFCVVSFDMVQHGLYSEGNFKNIDSNLNNIHNIFKTIEASYLDLNKIINTFEKHPLVDKNKIILTGFCIGAKLCYYALSKNNRIKASIPVNACPNFIEFLLHNYSKKEARLLDNIKETEIFDYIKKLNPYNSLIEKETRPILIINGERDDYIPAKVSVELYNKLEERYSKSSTPIELYISEDEHEISSDVHYKIINWLEDNFKLS